MFYKKLKKKLQNQLPCESIKRLIFSPIPICISYIWKFISCLKILLPSYILFLPTKYLYFPLHLTADVSFYVIISHLFLIFIWISNRTLVFEKVIIGLWFKLFVFLKFLVSFLISIYYDFSLFASFFIIFICLFCQ